MTNIEILIALFGQFMKVNGEQYFIYSLAYYMLRIPNLSGQIIIMNCILLIPAEACSRFCGKNWANAGTVKRMSLPILTIFDFGSPQVCTGHCDRMLWVNASTAAWLGATASTRSPLATADMMAAARHVYKVSDLKIDSFFGKFEPGYSYTILLANIFKWPLVMRIGAPFDKFLTNWSSNKCMLLEWGLFSPAGWIGYFKGPRMNPNGSKD